MAVSRARSMGVHDNMSVHIHVHIVIFLSSLLYLSSPWIRFCTLRSFPWFPNRGHMFRFRASSASLGRSSWPLVPARPRRGARNGAHVHSALEIVRSNQLRLR